MIRNISEAITYRFAISLTWLIVLCHATPTVLAAPAKIAIVIDDIGYRASDREAVRLQGQFTYSILPFAPLTQQLAQAVHHSKREAMLHLPMEAMSGNRMLGRGALFTDMDEKTMRAAINEALDNVPYTQGINNHMGSKFTTAEQPLRWLMDELKQRDLYFLDSKTTPRSLAEASAKRIGLATAHRHIFLDNQRDHQYLTQQFNRLLRIAKSNSYAIAIAHPHPETIAFLQNIGDRLKQENIELVPFSQILPLISTIKKPHKTSSFSLVAAPN